MNDDGPMGSAARSEARQSHRAGAIVLLSGRDLEAAVTPAAAIDALQDTYAALADNRADQGKSLGFAIDGGSLHVKAGLLPGARNVFAAKVNVNRPDNWAERRLPTIQGAVLLVDTVTGSPLAMMDSITLTAIRTAATAALAAGYGARPDSRTAAIIGCGAQAGYQLDAFKARFALSDVRAFDLDRARAEGFAARVASPDMAVTAVSSIADAVAGADIVITCTTAKQPVLTADMPLAGAFVAAMGADNPEKSEIAPDLLARARLLVDDIEACASGGDLFHAIRAGTVTREHVQADLADLAAGRKPGRTRPDEIVVFDSTGSGVQDVAVAQAAYQAALVSGAGFRFDLRGRR